MEKFVGTYLVIIDQMRKSDGTTLENAGDCLIAYFLAFKGHFCLCHESLTKQSMEIFP